MKKSVIFYTFLGIFLVLWASCSTKKDSFTARSYHSVTTEYNILYNGGLAYNEGILNLKKNYKNNFWEILPTEPFIYKEIKKDEEPESDPNFETAETKATKAIQKHAMNIENRERNPQMDEAHLLLGKARYYDGRFIPALEAFNYVFYKYPTSNHYVEAKIWREKTNIRLENEAVAIKSLEEILLTPKLKDSLKSMANAALAQAYINTNEYECALKHIKEAHTFAKMNDQKARYLFIKGQLYEKLQVVDSAKTAYQEVIKMNRKAPRIMHVWAHAKLSLPEDPTKNDSIIFLEKFNKHLENRENRPHIDVFAHHLGLYYERQKNFPKAIEWYNKSLRKPSNDTYLTASNYRNIADIYFDKPLYKIASQYYDSTLTKLPEKSKEFRAIKKKRDNLDDVIKYEDIANQNDSILSLVSMSEFDRRTYFERYIEQLKIKDAIAEAQKIEAEKLAQLKQANSAKQSVKIQENSDFGSSAMAPPSNIPSTKGELLSNNFKEEKAEKENFKSPVSSYSTSSNFYFYNPQTVAYGKKTFQTNYGTIGLKDNWKYEAVATTDTNENEEVTDKTAEKQPEKENEKYSVDYYLKQIPTETKAIDSLAKDRNFAYFMLGGIYSEQLKKYELAIDKYEKLLQNKPEERLILPSEYNLYKIYEKLNPEKAIALKNKIITTYPESRYAQLLSNPNAILDNSQNPETIYKNTFKNFEEEGDLTATLVAIEKHTTNFNGEPIVSKFELLKANVLARLQGLEAYKKQLQFVALTYPNTEESKEAQELLSTAIPKLEALKFEEKSTGNWKLVYEIPMLENANSTKIIEKVTKFVMDKQDNRIFISMDTYSPNQCFLVVHGFVNYEQALANKSIIQDAKAYKVPQEPIIISSENYKIVQIKKNITDYPKPNQPKP